MSKELPKLNAEQQKEVEKDLLPTAYIRESLEQNDRGNPKATVTNVVKILKEDPFFAGAICLNELSERIDIIRDLGWHREDRTLTDTDMAYITLYIEENYSIGNQTAIETAIRIVQPSEESRLSPCIPT